MRGVVSKGGKEWEIEWWGGSAIDGKGGSLVLVVVVVTRAGRETSTSQRTENGVTFLRPAPPASVSFRPRSRSVVLGESLHSFGIAVTASSPGLLLTRGIHYGLLENLVAPTVVVEAHYEHGLDCDFIYSPEDQDQWSNVSRQVGGGSKRSC